jgi:hypothetical protein
MADLGATVSSIAAVTGLSTVASSVSKFFGASGDLFKKPANVKLPLSNPLFAYASYEYVLGIGCLTKDEYHHPDTTYLTGKPVKLICKSANADFNNRVKTAYGKFDFFVDNVVLEQVIGFEAGTGNTNVANFTFDIVEPYSMGLFIMACQQIAQENGHDNWRDGVYILTIEFRGNKETGQISSVPNTARYIPFTFIDISMKVDAAGSSYSCLAMPCNMWALADNVALFKADHSASGKTVQEVLQTGAKSLQKVMNDRARDVAKKAGIAVADQYVILFPQQVASQESPTANVANTEKKTSATQSGNSLTDAAILNKLGVTQSTLNSTLVQQSNAVNAIGAAPLKFDQNRKADPESGKENQVYTEKGGIMQRGKIVIDPQVADFKFSQDTNIPNAINQVILQSGYVTEALDSKNLTPEGYRQWWRIDTQVYYLASASNTATGIAPKLYVYRVVPYLAHASRYLPPNTPPPGLKNLKFQAVKQYDYIYTGHSQDITSFNITINNGFTQIMAADALSRTQDKVTSANTGGSSKGGPDGQTSGMGQGSKPPSKLGSTPTTVQYAGLFTSSDNKGGGGPDTEATRAARLFQDAISNSVDLYELNLSIIGDPYYIAHSGTGNYTSAQTQFTNLNDDSTMNYQNGEVDIGINFRTPVDLNQGTGLFNFGGQSKSAPVSAFSGLYCLTNVTSRFSKGVFSQDLSGFRRPFQEGDLFAAPTAPTNATFSVDNPAKDTNGNPISNNGWGEG